MKFNLSVWDIARSVALLALVGFLWVNGQKLLDIYLLNSTTTASDLVHIADNAVKVAPIISKKALKELLTDFKKEKSKIIKEYEANKHKENLVDIAKITAETTNTRKLNQDSDKIYTGSEDKNLWYSFKEITTEGKDDIDVPIAWAKYSPYKEEGEWDTGVYSLKTNIKVINTENKDGTFNKYVEADILGKDDKKLKVDNINVEWATQSLKNKHWNLWNPRLGLGMNATHRVIGPRIDLSTLSYGRTDVDMDWRFVTFGLGGYTNEVGGYEPYLTFEPAAWNLGKIVPIVENVFIGPNVTVDSEYRKSFGLSLSVPF